MPIETVSELVHALLHGQLLEDSQRQEVKDDLQSRFDEPLPLAREMLRRGWLTAFQINQLFLGKADELVLGPYVLLDRLGEGGMGQVYKARHKNLGRIVALKVIRKECLSNPNALPRFHREIQAVAQLTHPNVIHAYDADEVNGTHFFSMEYVDGTDLSRLVKQVGPLPVLQACDYVRQAALGLQHAHERGLVHRDVKPANLLVTRPDRGDRPSGSSLHLSRPFDSAYRWGVVKILDMGLARVLGGDDAPDAPQLTQLGVLMGTPDYIAPEQARDSRTCDTRADLYSLGCTFYFLLAGQVPFPRGTVTEKLLQHQLDEPEPIEQARRDRLLRDSPGRAAAPPNKSTLEVPGEVAAAVRKLMAKRPEDRFRTPGELAETLALIARRIESGRLTGQTPRPRLKPTDRTIPDSAGESPPLARPVQSGSVANGSLRGSTEMTAHPPARPRGTQRIPLPRPGWLGPRTRFKLVFFGFLLATAVAGWLLERRDRSLSAVLPDRPPVNGAVRPPEMSEAERAWAKLSEKARQPGHNVEEVRRELLAFRQSYPGTEPGLRAATMLGRLPWPLDAADRDRINVPARELKLLPEELVAVLGEKRRTLDRPALCVAVSPDGRQLARGGSDGTVRRWRAATLEELAVLNSGGGAVRALAYSPDGRQLAAGRDDGSVSLGPAGADQEPAPWQAHKGPVLCLAFSPDGLTLATGGYDGEVKLWEVPGRRLLRVLPGQMNNRVRAVAFSPDGQLLACGMEDGVRLWAVSGGDGGPLASHAHESVREMAFGPDGRRLLVGAADGSLQLLCWDGKALRAGKRLTGHQGAVDAVAFSPDGRAAVSGGVYDGYLRLWEVGDGRELRTVRLWDPPDMVNGKELRVGINGLAFAPDGRHVAAAMTNGAVYLLRLGPVPGRGPRMVAAPRSSGRGA